MGARRTLSVAAVTAVVGAGTAVNRLVGVPLSSFASSPRLVGEGRVWLLVTSGVLADNPWLPSLAGFAVALAVASWVLPGHVVVSAAAAGQILSALLVYGCVGFARLLDPRAFGSVVGQSDFGLSAVIAAWIGAVAGVYWGRYPSARGRTAVFLGCLCCLGVGLAFRPHLTFLDSEHIVAFAIGATLVGPAWPRMVVPARRLVAVQSDTGNGFDFHVSGSAVVHPSNLTDADKAACVNFFSNEGGSTTFADVDTFIPAFPGHYNLGFLVPIIFPGAVGAFNFTVKQIP